MQKFNLALGWHNPLVLASGGTLVRDRALGALPLVPVFSTDHFGRGTLGYNGEKRG